MEELATMDLSKDRTLKKKKKCCKVFKILVFKILP